MSSSARRARERESTREAIVKTALNTLENEGIAALTMRRVATDIEYTAPTVYQHFANKHALVLELVAHGYRLMLTELKQVLDEPDPDRRLLRAASTYVRFAGQHRHLFDTMNTAVSGTERARTIIAPTLDFLRELLVAWADAHRVNLADHFDACEIVWGTLYGMTSLSYLDTIGNERAQHLATQALSAILLGWQGQQTTTTSGST
jgi:AcrR family transcriptional regulator